MTSDSGYSAYLPKARDLHARMLTVDTHCDTPAQMTLKGWDLGERHAANTLLGGDLDLIRMREGGLGAVFLAIFTAQGPRTPEGYGQARQRAEAMLDAVETTLRRHPDLCELALSPADARRIHGAGKRALFLGLENGYPLGRDLARLDDYHRRGIRYMTLCHATDNDLCAACTSWSDATMAPRQSEDTGLSPFGAAVVERMNALGMMVDVSHTSERTVADVLALSKAPVIASHSGARAVADHPRNLSDAQLRAIAAQGGVVQVLFVPAFLNPAAGDPRGDRVAEDLFKRMKARYATEAIGADPAVDAAFEAEYARLLADFPPPPVSVSDVADHIDHIVEVAGIDHVGIGSDFDGGGRLTDCRDISELPHLTGELLRRGYAEADLERIWGGNLLRVFDANLAQAGTTGGRPGLNL